MWQSWWFVVPLTALGSLITFATVAAGGTAPLIPIAGVLLGMGVGALKGRDWQEGALLGFGLLYLGVLIELGLVLAQVSRDQRAKRT